MKIIQSYVKEKYFVSTIHRESSAMTDVPIWYYETIVWNWDKKTRERGKMLDQYDSGMDVDDAIIDHYKICRNLANK